MAASATITPTRIDREAFYDERSAGLTMRVPVATLVRARREGSIRYSRRGKSVYYLGSWLADWLADGEVRPAERDLVGACAGGA